MRAATFVVSWRNDGARAIVLPALDVLARRCVSLVLAYVVLATSIAAGAEERPTPRRLIGFGTGTLADFFSIDGRRVD